MPKYVVRRVAYAIPILIAVSIIAFFLSAAVPGDVVEEHIAAQGELVATTQSYHVRMLQYRRTAERLDHHLPQFYFSILPYDYPDTLYRILRKDERTLLKTLLRGHGHWPELQRYRQAVLHLIDTLYTPAFDTLRWAGAVRQDAEFLLINPDPQRIAFLLNNMDTAIPAKRHDVRKVFSQITGTYRQIRDARPTVRSLIPSFHWHGLRNRYHRWLTGVVQGDFGVSIIDGRPVGNKIGDAIAWTLRINIAAILLAFLISVPLGILSARYEGNWFDKLTSAFLFAFFAIPSFWLATLCVVFLTTPEYGSWTNLFPTAGIGEYRYVTGTWERLEILISHLFLPVLCLLLGALAYLTRQMRGGVIREMRKDYIRMARAKGLSIDRIYWKHAARNALFPMITLVGAAIPATISGSVIIEVIFNIPGMGRLLYDSIRAQDWSVVFAMVIIAAVLTVIGYIISDLLYHWMDPRVRLSRS